MITIRLYSQNLIPNQTDQSRVMSFSTTHLHIIALSAKAALDVRQRTQTEPYKLHTADSATATQHSPLVVVVL